MNVVACAPTDAWGRAIPGPEIVACYDYSTVTSCATEGTPDALKAKSM